MLFVPVRTDEGRSRNDVHVFDCGEVTILKAFSWVAVNMKSFSGVLYIYTLALWVGDGIDILGFVAFLKL